MALARVRTKKKRNRWLELIAVYKLLQAILLISVAEGALKLLHKDAAEVLARIATTLQMNTEGRLMTFLLDKAALLNDHRLRQISIFLFGYAALGLIEGIGLMMEKVWAEYFTSIITASFLPLEIFELMHRVTWVRIALRVLNLAVLVYLVAHLGRRRASMRKQK